ncbi:PAS domain S-box protein [uncultured Rhodospira sp.]|uniref:PAS domain S-box protein n=1 Tax=uncultured Rhodospira sp. TaxID=1936189 RepID=UPI002637F536|nr:PAS domain S-box protein [uncultured Rhodospira sp.]
MTDTTDTGTRADMRMTVATSLKMTMGGMLILILVSSVVSVLSFHQMTARITPLTDRVLPTFAQADVIKDLAREIERLAHQIPNATGSFELETLLFAVRDNAEALQAAIDELDPDLVGGDDKAAAHRNVELVEQAIVHLHGLMLQRETLDVRVREAASSLVDARRIVRAVATDDGNAPGAEGASDRPTNAPPEPEMVALLQIVDQAETAILSTRPAQVAAHRDRFESLLNRFLADPSVNRPVSTALLKVRAHLRPVFETRLQALRLDLQIRIAVKRLVALDRLINHITALTHGIADRTRVGITDIEQTVMTRTPVLLAASILSILLAVAGLIYINTQVLRRMRRVRAVMQDHVHGHRPPLDIGGGDEIADMAHSFEHFVRAVDEKTGQVQRQRDLVTAVLDSMTVGVAAFDKDLNLIAWNRPFLEIRDYPEALAQPGTKYAAFVQHDVARQEFGEGDPEAIFARQMEEAARFEPCEMQRRRPDGRFVDVRRGPIKGGGFVSIFSDITARMKAEEALTKALEENRRQSDRFQNLTANLPAMVVQFEICADGRPRIEYASPDMQAVFGFSGDGPDPGTDADADADAAHPLLDRVHPADRPDLEAEFRRLSAGDSVLHHTFRVIDTDGGTRWIELAARAYPRGEERWGWDGMLLDVTQRKLAEDALRRNEETLRAILESSPVGAGMVQRDGSLSFANAAMAALLDVDRDDLNETSMASYYADTGDEQLFLEHLRAGEPIRDHEVTLHRRDGHALTALVTLIPAGTQGSHFCWVYDITEQKAAEQAIHEKEKTLRAILETSPVGTTIVTAAGHLSFANTAAASMLGLTPEEMVETHPRDFYEDPAQRDAVMARAAAGETVFNEEIVLRRADGSTVDALLTLVPTPDGESFFAWVFDITKRKRAEDEVRAKMLELEQFSRIAVGRELRMITLKREINALTARLGDNPPYQIAD